MSIDSAKAYVERMKTDEGFRKKVLECKDAKTRMELVKAEGFDFTEVDIKVVAAEVGEAELGHVIGGAGRGREGMTKDEACVWGRVFSLGVFIPAGNIG